MGLVLQVNYLFTGTVMENIRYATPGATEAPARASFARSSSTLRAVCRGSAASAVAATLAAKATNVKRKSRPSRMAISFEPAICPVR